MAVYCRTPIADVGDEHVRKGCGTLCGLTARLNVSLLGSRDDVDWSAIHIHFAVANPIKPCPGKGVLSWCNASRDFVCEGRGASARGVVTQVSVRSEWASTFNGVDHAPLGVFCRFLVCGKGHLARASTVRSPADERQGLRVSDSHLVESKSSFWIIDARTLLARKIRPVRGQRAVVES